MLAEERKRRVLEMINSRKIVKVSELSSVLNATEATIRRDLEELQKQKKLRRIHGGAAAINQTSRMLDQHQLLSLCEEEKRAIALKAYEYVEDHDAILLDVSTTVLELAKLIGAGKHKGLSIITNSFAVVQTLRSREDVRVIHTGGQVVNALNSSLGGLAEKMIRNIKVEKCFIGTNGIAPGYGYSSPTFEEASIKQAMIAASKVSFVLSDHTKYGETYMGKFAEFSGTIDYFITDALPAPEERGFYEGAVEMILANPSRAPEIDEG